MNCSNRVSRRIAATIGYDELARALGMEPASARSAVHRLRKRFREVFREEVAGTVADPGEVDAEMRAVIAALGERMIFSATFLRHSARRSLFH